MSYAVWLVLIAGSLLNACKDDDEVVVKLPEITTSAIKDITATSATAGGNIISNGNAAILAAGVCYSITNATPTTSDEKVASTTLTGAFSVTLNNLVSGTKYYVRAFATNSTGTAYGDAVTLETSNLAPEATNVQITGVKAVGSELTASYTYADAENNAESGSTFQWYRADDGSGSNEAPITDAHGLKYTLADADLGKFVRIGITPKASAGTSTGTEVKSGYTGPVEPKPNAAPTAADVSITGTTQVDEILTVAYTYADEEGDAENGTIIKWYRADNASGLNESVIDGAAASAYTLTGLDENKYVRAGVTPKAEAGTQEGAEVKSNAVGPIAAETTTVTFTYNGTPVTYGIVKSSVTGRKWLDRNLGAPNAPSSYDDYANYGDLFQWGRAADGHQLIVRGATNPSTTSVNGTTETLSATDNPGHALFILIPAQPGDWRTTANDGLWQGVTGTNNPCPTGWRIPTEDDWQAENLSLIEDAYSQIKLTLGGYRFFDDAGFSGTSAFGYYWSSTISSESTLSSKSIVAFQYRTTSQTNRFTIQRGSGLSCKCIKE